MSRILTEAEVKLAQTTALQPWKEPTEIIPVPTPEEMENWYPNPAPEAVRWRTEINIGTKERKWIELTLEEYRARHVAKIKANNEWLLRTRVLAGKANREEKLNTLIDALITDPTLLDKLIKG